MEGAQVTFEQHKDYLLVIGHGERNSFAEIVAATTQISDAIVGQQKKYLLIDYRNVRFNIPITNVFDVVRIYEAKMPHLKNVFAAVVLSEQNRDVGKFWKDIAQRRGFHFMVFENLQQAESWLSEQRVNQSQTN